MTKAIRRVWTVLWNAARTFHKIDGELRAASFAYYAFFSLFPLTLLVVSVGSTFLPAGLPERMIAMLRNYMTLDDSGERLITSTIDGVVAMRGKVGLLAFAAILWGAMRFFQALTIGINRAWGRRDYCWVSLSLKNLAMVGILASALLLGALVPMILDAIGSLAQFRAAWLNWIYQLGRGLVPSLVLFYGFLMLYRFAPRHKTSFKDVWLSAALVTILVQISQRVFVFYAFQVANFNAIYGTLGGVLILLMWIYITGMIIIFGGCLCASGARIRRRARPAARQPEKDPAKPERSSRAPVQPSLFHH